MTTVATQVEGLRSVSGSTERDVLFPSPSTNQKVYNQTTGNIEEWNGSAWITVFTGARGAITEFFVRSFGAVGDGVADDTVAIQAAITAASAVMSGLGTGGAVVQFGPGTFKLTAQLVVGGSIKMVGAGPASTILKCYGVHGISLAADEAQLHNLELFSFSGAGSADPKLYDGVTGAGTSGTHVNNQVLNNVVLRGWARAIYAKYSWTAVYHSVSTVNCDKGYVSFGLCGNNAISDCFILADTHGLSLIQDTPGVHGEGLNVTGTVIASAAIGIFGDQFISLNVVGCTIDQCGAGFNLTNVTGSCVGCWVFSSGNAFEFEDLSGITAGSFKVVGCPMIWSTGARAFQIGAFNRFISIVGNNVQFATLALWTATNAGKCVFAGNTCIDSTGVQPFHVTLQAPDFVIDNNIGDCKISASANLRSPRLNNGDAIVTRGFTAHPTAGTWKLGDIVLNDTGTNSNGWAWICVVAGTPGTWVPLVAPAVSQTDADANYTIADAGAEYPTVYFNVNLTADRVLTLPSRASSWGGRKFRIVRAAGAGTLTVKDPTGPTTLKVLPAATPSFCDVEFAGALLTPAWILTAYGTL